MYESLKVYNFRCFERLEIPSLRRVNLIAGANNVGKTALLEALLLHSGNFEPEHLFRMWSFPLLVEEPPELLGLAALAWRWLFRGWDTSNSIVIEGQLRGGRVRRIRLEVAEPEREVFEAHNVPKRTVARSRRSVSGGFMSVMLVEDGAGRKQSHRIEIGTMRLAVEPPIEPQVRTIFLPARQRVRATRDAERFGRLEMVGQEEIAVQALRVIEPRLRRLSVVVVGGVPLLHGDIGIGRLVPLPVLGEGMGRLASVVLAVANAAKGITLVDEIENGLHHSVLTNVWLALAEAACQFDAQIFATTHSLECIRAAHRAFLQRGEYDFQLIRLESTEGGIRAVAYDESALEAAIEASLEVR